jgi:hypothetical protein
MLGISSELSKVDEHFVHTYAFCGFEVAKASFGILVLEL